MGVLAPLAGQTPFEFLYWAAAAIHSYLGYILFAPVWAALWYGVFAWISRRLAKKVMLRGEVATNPVYLQSFADVFLVVLLGGFCHFFIDCIGHIKNVAPYSLRGHFVLLFEQEGVVALVYGIIVAIIVVGVLIHNLRKIKPMRQQFAQKLKEIFRSKQFLKVLAFFGIALLNTLFLYIVQLPQGPLETNFVNDVPYPYTEIFFNLSLALQSTRDFAGGEATWYLIICVICLIVLFFIAHLKMKKVTLFGHTFRAELLIFVGFLIAMLVGYLLQPIIGNISGDERDLGSLVFIWSTLGTVLLGAAFVHAKIYEETRTPDLKQ